MARIFNIYFSHEGSSYSAMVSIRETPFFTEYTLNNFDENILNQLPTNKIIARSGESFIFQNAPLETITPLMNEIISALTRHVETATKA